MYVPSRKAAEILGVHPNTLRRWANEGVIQYVLTPSGHRRYDVSSVSSTANTRKRYLYARVSSRSQKTELANQSKYLRERYPDSELIEDVGSGLNFKRKGLRRILDELSSGLVEEIVVTHRDRLCRFGFELIEHLAIKNNARIVVLDQLELSPQEELVRDLISIIHVFSCRVYGLRRYASEVSKDKNLSQESVAPDSKEVSGAVETLVQ